MGTFLVISCAFGATIPGGVDLEDSEIFQTMYSGKTYTCGLVASKWIPGRIAESLFLSTKAEITYIKKTIKKTRDSRQKLKLSKKQKTLETKLESGTVACEIGSGGSTGGNFDALGNLTAAGKIAFQVPSSLSASANKGISTWSSKCYGCHLSSPLFLRPNTFPAIKERIQQSPMFFRIPEEVTDQEIADIVAYRNF